MPEIPLYISLLELQNRNIKEINTWFQSALEEAKAVLADSDATQAMVDSAGPAGSRYGGFGKDRAGSGGHAATGDWLVSGISILLAALAMAGAGIVIFRRRKRDA